MNDGLPEKGSQHQERRAVRVSLTFEDFRSFITQYSSHVSMGGMFIGTRTPLPPGTFCKLDVRLKSGDSLIGGLGEVVWTRDRAQGPQRPPGMGVRFRELEDSSRDLVFAIVDRRLVDGGNVFQLEEGGEEQIPNLDELLERAELHRREAEGRVAAHGKVVAEGGTPTDGETVLPDVEPGSQAWEGGLVGPVDSSRWAEELTSADDLPEEEALPSIRPEALEALEALEAPEGSPTSVLPDVPNFDDEDFDPPAFDEADLDESGFDEATFDETGFDEDDFKEAGPEDWKNTGFDPGHESDRLGPSPSPSEQDPAPADDMEFEPRKRGLMTELYPGLAERLEGDQGGAEETFALSTEEVLLSLEKPALPAVESPSGAKPELPDPTPAETPAETPENELDARLRAADDLVPPLEEKEPAPPVAEPSPPTVAALEVGEFPLKAPRAAPVEESWSGYTSSPASRTRWLLWLVPLLILLLGGAGYYFRQQGREVPSTEDSQRPAPAAVAESSSGGILQEAPPSPSATADPVAEPPLSTVTEGVEPPVTGASAEPTPPPSLTPSLAPSLAPPEPGGEPGNPMTQLLDISWRAVPEGTLVTLTVDGSVQVGAFTHVRIGSDEPRLLIRLLKMQKDPRRGATAVGTPELRRIRTGFHPKESGNEVHVVLDLGGETVDATRVEPQANTLLVWLSKVP